MKYVKYMLLTAVVVILLACTSIGYAWTTDPDEGDAGGVGTITTEYYTVKFKTDKLGLYNVKIDTYETPYYEVLPIIGAEYFKSNSLELTTNIDNIPPNARYSSTPVTKIDIRYNNSYYSNNWLLEAELRALVAELDGRPDLDVSFDMVSTAETYDIPHQYIETVGSNDTGYTSDKTYVSGEPDNTTINFPKMQQNGLDAGAVTIGWFVRININHGHIENIYPNTTAGYAGYTVRVEGSISGTMYTYDSDLNVGDYICDFTIVDSNTLKLNTTDETFPMQLVTVYVDSKIVGETDPGAWGWGAQLRLGKWKTDYTTGIRPTYLITGLNQMSWRPDAIKFVVYGNHDTLRAYEGDIEDVIENEYFIEELNYLQANQIYYIGAGSPSNLIGFINVIGILRYIIVGDDNSALFTDTTTNLKWAVYNQMKPFIESKVPSYNASVDWILVDTTVNWETTYDDREKDPPLNLGEHDSDYTFLSTNGIQQTSNRYQGQKILAEKWRYRHNYGYFDNSMGIVTYHNVWIPDPQTTFDKVGQYRINYKRMDNPLYPNMDLSNAFNSYRYWSTDYDYKLNSE